MTSEWTKDPTDLEALLEKWRGAKAEIWAYTASHGVLILAIRNPMLIGYIQFRDCQSILAHQTAWENLQARIDHQVTDLGTVHSFIDPGNLEVVAWFAAGTESSESVNFHAEWSSVSA